MRSQKCAKIAFFRTSMTVIVGIRCKDGIVVGADGSVTFVQGQQRTIEQPTKKKIRLIGGKIIVASSGHAGYAQRFHNVVESLWNNNEFSGKTPMEIAKRLSIAGLADFQETQTRQLDLACLVAYVANKNPVLCELSSSVGFQPEIKEEDDIWFVSVGGGQSIVDPFLGFLRSVFWKDGAPKLREGIFMALWALEHACEVNPGGINEPITISVLEGKKGKYSARILSDDELQETHGLVADLTFHMSEYRQNLLGDKGATEVP